MKKEKNSGILKKIKGKWVAVLVSGGILLGAGGVLAETGVLAQVNSAAVSMMSTINSSQFNNKDTYMADENIQKEAQASLDRITSFWSFNSVEEVRAEIERQEAAGLDVYVVQWGDTLSVLAEAADTSVEALAEQNQINNWNLILTGDLLDGVLRNASVDTTSKADPSSDKAQADSKVTDSDEMTEAERIAAADKKAQESYSDQLLKEDTPDGDLVTGDLSDIGDDDAVETKFFRVEEDVNFATEFVSDDTLALGERVVEQEGQNGLRVSYYGEFTYADGSTKKSDLVLSEKETVEPVTEIIRVGTKETEDSDVVVEDPAEEPSTPEAPSAPEDDQSGGEESTTHTATEEETEVITFEVERIESDELLEGETEVQQEGVDGERTITSEVIYENGEEVSRNVVSSEVTKEPVNQIVLVGTGQVEDLDDTDEQGEEPSDEVISDEIIDETVETPGEEKPEDSVTDDQSDDQGSDDVSDDQNQGSDEQPGEESQPEENAEGDETSEDGETSEGEEDPADDQTDDEDSEGSESDDAGETDTDEEPPATEPDQPSETEGDQSEQPTEPAIERVVRQRKQTESVPFETVYRDNDQVEAGEERVVQQGKNGVREQVIEEVEENGVIVETKILSDEIIEEPVARVIERGTREVRTEIVMVEEAIIPGRIKRNTDSLEVGQERVVQQGERGLWEVPHEVTYVNGVETSRVRTNLEKNVIRASKPEIVEVGTRQPNQSSDLHSGRRVSNVQYTTSSRESLESIARRFGTTVDQIRRDNNISGTHVNANTPLTINNATARPMDIPQSYDNRRVVMIDPGHGGTDPGAVSGSRREKEINLQMARRLRDKLTARGYEVIMLRNGDVGIRNIDRGRQANASGADIYVSIHQNAHNGAAQGIETFYYRYSSNYPSAINGEYHNDPQRVTNSKHLATLVQNEMIKATGATNRGVKRSSFQVLRETDIPAILLEAGFIDNRTEGPKLTQAQYQDRLMEAVANGIDQYFKDVHGN